VVQACIFDIGGVLMRGSAAWAAATEAVTGIPTAERRPIFVEVETLMSGRKFVAEDMVPLLASRIEDRLGPRAEAAARRMSSTFTDPSALEPIEPMMALLAELHGSGVRTGILTNGSSDAVLVGGPAHVLRSGHVYASVVSGRDGVGKPQPEAFALILERLGVAADDAWFVDDQPVLVEAGRACGLHGVVFDGDVAQLVGELRASGLRW
jgi:HAD superfamily hydrolase (TIGR01509 family)